MFVEGHRQEGRNSHGHVALMGGSILQASDGNELIPVFVEGRRRIRNDR